MFSSFDIFNFWIAFCESSHNCLIVQLIDYSIEGNMNFIKRYIKRIISFKNL